MQPTKISDAVLWAEFEAGQTNAQIAAAHPSISRQAVAKRRQRWKSLGCPPSAIGEAPAPAPSAEAGDDVSDNFGALVDAMLAGDERVNRLDPHTYTRVSEVAARVARARKDAPPTGPTWVEMQEIIQTFISFVEAEMVAGDDRMDDRLAHATEQFNGWIEVRFPAAPR